MAEKTIVINAGTACNSRCTTCSLWKTKSEPLPLPAIEKLLSSETLERVLTLYVTGGEPYLNGKMLEIAKLIKRYRPKLILAGATNGLDPEGIIAQAKAIRALGVFLNVDVSLNGSREVHNATRGRKDAYDKAIQTIEGLIEIGVKPALSMILSPATVGDIDHLRGISKRYGLILGFSHYRPSPRFGTAKSNVRDPRDWYAFWKTWTDAQYRARQAIENLPEIFKCPALKYRVYIDDHGDVFPCEERQDVLLGNIGEEDFDDIVNGEKWRIAEEEIEAKVCQPCVLDCFKRRGEPEIWLGDLRPQSLGIPKPKRQPKVLVGCPIWYGYEYSPDYIIDFYLKAVDNLDYDNYELHFVDNSANQDHVPRLKSLIVNHKVVFDAIPREGHSRYIQTKCQNILRQYAIDKGFDYLLMIESDVVPPPDVIQHLTRHKKDVVGGIFEYGTLRDHYPFITEFTEVEMANNKLFLAQSPPAVTTPILNSKTLTKVAGTGMGVVLISRKILEALPFRYDETRPSHADSYFAMDLRGLGVDFFVDPAIITAHYSLWDRPGGNKWHYVKDR